MHANDSKDRPTLGAVRVLSHFLSWLERSWRNLGPERFVLCSKNYQFSYASHKYFDEFQKTSQLVLYHFILNRPEGSLSEAWAFCLCQVSWPCPNTLEQACKMPQPKHYDEKMRRSRLWTELKVNLNFKLFSSWSLKPFSFFVSFTSFILLKGSMHLAFRSYSLYARSVVQNSVVSVYFKH